MPVFLLRKKLVERTEGNCSYAEYSASVGHCARGDFSFAFPLVPIYVTRMGSSSAAVPVPVSVYAGEREREREWKRRGERGCCILNESSLLRTVASLLLLCHCGARSLKIRRPGNR